MTKRETIIKLQEKKRINKIITVAQKDRTRKVNLRVNKKQIPANQHKMERIKKTNKKRMFLR